jgi:hypothetical protein
MALLRVDGGALEDFRAARPPPEIGAKGLTGAPGSGQCRGDAGVGAAPDGAAGSGTRRRMASSAARAAASPAATIDSGSEKSSQ